MQFNQAQNELFITKMNEALDNQWMSWDKELKAWHKLALKSLEHESMNSLQIEPNSYGMLLIVQERGLNMNVVMVLVESMKRVTPAQMGSTLEQWANIMKVNTKILDSWHKMVEPTRKKIEKEVELMIIPARRIIN